MRILITGGSGYIGSVLIPYLTKEGHFCTVVDLSPPVMGCQFVAGDVRDMRLIQPLLREADAVIPLAGVVGAPACKVDGYGAKTINSFAIRDLLSRLSPDQKIVFPATDSGYPQGLVDERSEMRPQSLYAITKYEAEQEVLAHHGVTLRLASVFGMSPRMRTDLIVNNFVYHAVIRKPVDVYEGHYRRNFCHILDIASAFNHALGLPTGSYNVGNITANRSKLEICALIKRWCQWFEFHRVEGKTDPDRRDNIVSNTKIEATGWRATHSLAFGIAELIEGYTNAEADASVQ